MNALHRPLWIIAFSCLLPHGSAGQVGFLDNTFGIGGTVVTDFIGHDYCADAAVQSDGKILLVGSTYDTTVLHSDYLIARYTVDGFLDSTFSSDGFDTLDLNGYVDEAKAVAVRADGRIVVAGETITGGHTLFGTIQYLADGTLDTSFGTDGEVNTLVAYGSALCRAVAIDDIGRVIVAGQDYTTTYDAVLLRYSADGVLDPSFGGSGIIITTLPYWQAFNDIALQPDGKILCCGDHSLTPILGGPPGAFLLCRFNADGTPDGTFNSTGILIDSLSGFDAASIVLQPDGRIVLGGGVLDGGIYRMALARYNSDGSIDSTFGTNGRVITPIGSQLCRIQDMTLLPDGRIVVGAVATSLGNTFVVVRYAPDGSIDGSFGIGGIISNPIGPSTNALYDVHLQPSGKLVASGWSVTPGGGVDFSMLRYGMGPSSVVEDAAIDDPVSVIPQPLTSRSTIAFSNPTRALHAFTLFDANGRTIEEQRSSLDQFIVHKGTKRPGLYAFTLVNTGTGETRHGRIVIE